MMQSDDRGRFSDLSEIAEKIFTDCNDDPACIAHHLRRLDPQTLEEILSSDLLNAWQVFFYYFGEIPGDEAVEFLIFHPAGELIRGVPMGDIAIFTLTFIVRNNIPVIVISDDIQEVARYSGKDAWQKTTAFIHTGE
jgi:hypothetical protein